MSRSKNTFLVNKLELDYWHLRNVPLVFERRVQFSLPNKFQFWSRFVSVVRSMQVVRELAFICARFCLECLVYA